MYKLSNLQVGQNKAKNVVMAWIDYKKANDILSQTWIIEHLKLYKISGKVTSFVTKAMENWKVKLIARGQTLSEVKVQRSIFQRDSLSPNILFIVMIPLKYIFKKCSVGY